MKQFRWVFLLKIQKAWSLLCWVFSASFEGFSSAKGRLLSTGNEGRGYKGRLLRFIRGLMVAAMVVLAFELIAHFKGWYARSLRVIRPSEIDGFLHWIYLQWLDFMAEYIARSINFLSDFFVVLFMIQSVDRVVLCIGCFWINFRRIKPWVADGKVLGSGDVEAQGSDFPLVLVQIPMCNEREPVLVYNRKPP